jgi:hypothetical protein
MVWKPGRFRETLSQRIMRIITMPTPRKTPDKVCHFLRLPLETRDAIYRLLLTTPFCTDITEQGISLEFTLCTELLKVNKQIAVEATRVLLKDNVFIELRLTGLELGHETALGFSDLDLGFGKAPFFRQLIRDKVQDPVLRAGVEFLRQDSPHHNRNTFTITTTAEGIEYLVSRLWREENYDAEAPQLSGLSISLDFKAKASVRREDLANRVLKPWEKLHGIQQLSLTGDIGDCMRQHLERSMLEGPCPAEVLSILGEYHSLGEHEMLQENYKAAQWWWMIFDKYWIQLGILRTDASRPYDLQDDNNPLWNDVWVKGKKMYFKGISRLVKTLLYQEEYEEAMVGAKEARYEWSIPLIDIEYTVSPILQAKFDMVDAFAYTALEQIEEGLKSLTSAAKILSSNDIYKDNNIANSIEDITEALSDSIAMELDKLDSLYRSEQPMETERSPSRTSQVESTRSFWEWLDLPEE